MKKRRNEENEGGADDWIVSYSDIMSLLLAFFILLFAFSTIDAEKWRRIVASFNGEPSVIEIQPKQDNSIISINEDTMGVDSIIINNIDEKIRDDMDESEQQYGESDQNLSFEELYEEIKRYTVETGLDSEIEVIKKDKEIILRFSNSIMFETAKASLDDDAINVLDGIAGLIGKYQGVINELKIEGNTDDIPIHSAEYQDNYELSMQRALVVLRYFKDKNVCVPEKLVAVGYGEYKPIADNATSEGRAKNRRTDILIVEK